MWGAKQKAITDLKVKKRDIGLLAIVNAESHDGFSKGKNADFAFESEDVEEITEGRSFNKIQKEWTVTTTSMQNKVADWKEAKGDRKSELLQELKALTVKKKQLEAELDTVVAGKDKDIELVITEGRQDGGKLAKTHVVYMMTIKLKDNTYMPSFRVAVTKGSDAEDRAIELAKGHFGKEFGKITAIGKALNPEIHSIKESIINEKQGTSDLENYIKSKLKDRRINPVTFEEVVDPLAIHIDTYTGSTMGDLEYTKNTINTFKKLVDLISKDHIDGSDLEESVTKPTWETLIERIGQPTNEGLREDVKKFIKKYNKELNTLADNDQWDSVYDKLYSDFAVEADSSEGKDLLKAFQFSF
jgi:hypothetical protein